MNPVQQALQGACRFCGVMTEPLMLAKYITEEVAQEHRVPLDDLHRGVRLGYIIAARACAMRRIRAETNLSLKQIGEFFGLDHTTVLHHLGRNGRADAAAATSRQGTA